MRYCTDSRQVQEGDIFFCIPGLTTDGHKYIGDVLAKGVSEIVYSSQEAVDAYLGSIEEAPDVIWTKVADSTEALNKRLKEKYGYITEQMDVFAVTGTNGKTTIASILQQILGKTSPCAYLGTLGAKVDHLVLHKDSGMTTPDPVTLHTYLEEFEAMGAKALALEISSHALAMHRADALDVDVAIFTNLTHDHLDYHKTMEAYFEAKALLFKNLKPSGIAILNRDSDTFERLEECISAKVISYGIEQDADYRALDLDLSVNESRFTLLHAGVRYAVKSNLIAHYNVYNLLAVIAALHSKGMAIEEILPHLETIEQIDGRFEMIDEGQSFPLIVDYAHTPDGYTQLMGFAKGLLGSGGEIIAVFGQPHGRDIAKRPILGRIASEFCGKIVLTSQDPGMDDPREIFAEIKEGISSESASTIYEVIDRAEAISFAISMAKEGDIVLVLGKGDETYFVDKAGKHAWPGDNEVSRQALREQNND